MSIGILHCFVQKKKMGGWREREHKKPKKPHPDQTASSFGEQLYIPESG